MMNFGRNENDDQWVVIDKKKTINQKNAKLLLNFLVGSIFFSHNNHQKVITITK